MKLFALVACLTACNQVYGLDETTVRDPFANDADRDSIRDAIDNCPDVANADQADTDGDDLGDECDFCPFCQPCDAGANHDEDGDLLDDACDNCPAYANADQANSDRDDLGNACDPSGAIHRRRLFDGFRTLSPDWLPNGAPWGIDQDGVMPMPGFGENTYLLRHRTVEITSGETWFIDIGIDPRSETLAGLSLTGPGNQLACHVIRTPSDPDYLLSNNAIADTTQLPESEISRLRFVVSGSVGAQRMVCEVVDVHTVTMTTNILITYPMTLDLRTIGSPRFRYIDVIGP